MKHQIRKAIRERHKEYSDLEKTRNSDIIRVKLLGSEEFKKARVVMFYVSLKDEVDTIPMIDEALRTGKRVCVPVIVKNERRLIAGEITDRQADLERQHFGIYQPKKDRVREVPLEDIDVVIVPGVAFDTKNVRLGRGHGYYDRFLSGLPSSVTTIGLAFNYQVIDHLPQDPHDIPVSKVITA